MTSTWQLQNIGKVLRIKWSQCPSSLIRVLSAMFTEYPGTVCWELQLTSQSEVKIISLFSLHSLQWSWIKDLVIGLTISVNREFYFETLFATKKIVFYKSQDNRLTRTDSLKLSAAKLKSVLPVLEVPENEIYRIGLLNTLLETVINKTFTYVNTRQSYTQMINSLCNS